MITPYNMQVAALLTELPNLRIGTADKFYGQEAPIAIYSMATSSAWEAPRVMEFLYSLNRLNVATSRAQCLAVVVASPVLLQVRCRTPRQMQRANALVRFVEKAAESSLMLRSLRRSSSAPRPARWTVQSRAAVRPASGTPRTSVPEHPASWGGYLHDHGAGTEMRWHGASSPGSA